MQREVPVESTREHTEVFSFDTQTDDLATVISAVSPTLEGTTPDGYSGVLMLDISTIAVESQGTQTLTSRAMAGMPRYMAMIQMVSPLAIP